LFAPQAISAGKTEDDVPRLSWFRAYQWYPSKSPAGPLTVLMSTADERVLVIRNGIEIGRARITVAPGAGTIGTQAYVLLAGDTGQPSAVVPSRRGLLWQSIPMPGYEAKPGHTLDPAIVANIRVPPEFAAKVYDELAPGSTIVLTDAAILPQTTGKAMTVITTGDEPGVE